MSTFGSLARVLRARIQHSLRISTKPRHPKLAKAGRPIIDELERRVLLSVSGAAITGQPTFVEGQAYTLSVSGASTTTGTPVQWRVNWDDSPDGPPDLTTLTTAASTFTLTHTFAVGNYRIDAQASDDGGTIWTDAGLLNGQLDSSSRPLRTILLHLVR